jgi:DNA end-binding protein Ku
VKLIADKKKAKKPSKAKASKSPKGDDEDKSNVVNIMDALKKSVAQELKSRKAE